jgi:hypothetical protein
MKNLGWQHDFTERSWADVREFLEGVNWSGAEARYMFDIIDSVFAVGADALLAVSTSMHDLLVVPRPVPLVPYDVIFVRAPGSISSHPDGTVKIEFCTANGHRTEIVRPAIEAVPLFWRFLNVEFGIKANSPDSTPTAASPPQATA